MRSAEIAIIGMAGRFPGAGDVEELCENLRRGRESIGPIPKPRIAAGTLDPDARYRVMGYVDDVDRFDYAFFGIPPGEARTLSPNARLLLQEAWHAFESAGCPPARFRGSRTDVYMTQVDSVYTDLADEESTTLFTGNSPDFIVARLNRQFDLRGNSVIVDTSCSSGVAAVLMACDALRLERADYALVCGTNLQLFPYERPSLLDTWSADGRSRSYAADANGMAAGEAVVCFLLTPLARARAEGHVVHAVIRGGALNNNGAVSNSPSAPHSVMQAQVINRAWEEAGIAPGELGFIEGHGSATLLGDSLEVEAFRIAFAKAGLRARPCALSSVKANIGHGKAAAGLSSVVKAVLAVERGLLFPAPNVRQVNSVLGKPDSPVYVNTELVSWADERRTAAVHSFGMSGVNCHLVLENHREAVERRGTQGAAPDSHAASDSRAWFPVPVCARTPPALYENAAALRQWLAAPDTPPVGDVAHTLSLGREHLEHRSLVLARDKEELAGAWDALLASAEDPRWKEARRAPRVLLLLSSDDGEASRYRALAAELGGRFPRFRRRLEAAGAARGDAAFVVAFQLALHDLLQAMGLAGALVGVGPGKLAASVVAGTSTEEQAFREAAAAAAEPLPDVEARAASLVSRQLEQGAAVFLQMGPESAVSRAVRGCAAGTAARVECFEEDGVRSLGGILATLFRERAALQLGPWFEEQGTVLVRVPGYRFARTRCWLRETPKPHPGASRTAEGAEAPSWNRRWAGALPLERRVGEIWRELLGHDRFGPEDNLFELGADSLLATRIVRRVNQELGVRCDFEDVFDCPTVAALTRLVRAQCGVKRIVVTIWQDVLKTAELGEEDDFFELGGHSLLANEILHRVRREFGAVLSFEDFFAAPTPAAFAAAVEARLPQAGPAAAASSPKPSKSPEDAAAAAPEPSVLTPETWAAVLRRREMF